MIVAKTKKRKQIFRIRLIGCILVIVLIVLGLAIYEAKYGDMPWNDGEPFYLDTGDHESDDYESDYYGSDDYTYDDDYEYHSPSTDYSDGSSSLPSTAISLYMEGADIICASSKEKYSEMIGYIVAQDEYSGVELIANGDAFFVPSNTKAIVLERSIGSAKVRILEGVYEGVACWVASEAVS